MFTLLSNLNCSGNSRETQWGWNVMNGHEWALVGTQVLLCEWNYTPLPVLNVTILEVGTSNVVVCSKKYICMYKQCNSVSICLILASIGTVPILQLPVFLDLYLIDNTDTVSVLCTGTQL